MHVRGAHHSLLQFVPNGLVCAARLPESVLPGRIAACSLSLDLFRVKRPTGILDGAKGNI